MPIRTDKNIKFQDAARLLVLEVTDSVEELIQKFDNIDLVFDEFNKFSTDKRKKEFLSIRLAFKKLLGKDVIIRYDEQGKPYLEDHSYNISISHSGNWIAIIAHPTRFVGIDIECPSPKIKKLYTRFLSEAEQEDFSYGKDLRHLQLTWSAKEALYKIIGIQAVDFAKQLRIFPFEVKGEGEFKALHLPTNTDYNLSYLLTDNYALVYCIH